MSDMGGPTQRLSVEAAGVEARRGSPLAKSAAAEDYPLWPAGFLFRLLLRYPSWLVGLAAFGAYWGLPCLMAAWDGTLAPASSAARGASGLQLLVSAILGKHPADGPAAYLADRSHFLFAVVLALGTAVWAMILKRIGLAMDSMSRDRLAAGEAEAAGTSYARFRRWANHPAGRLLSVVLAAGTLLFFLHLREDPSLSRWWGSAAHGQAGLVFAGIEFVMVYCATQGLFLIIGASLMIAVSFGRGLQLRPFHPDGCNGLSSIGTVIFLLWTFALLLAAAIFVTMYLGYLGLEKTQLAWALAILATLAVPFAAIVPLAAAVRSTMRARESQLRELEPLLQDMFARAVAAAQRGEDQQWQAVSDRLGKLQELYGVLTAMNIWPFNPRALTLIMTAYGVQALITLHEFVGSVPFELLEP
jgi:hypothetical protein